MSSLKHGQTKAKTQKRDHPSVSVLSFCYRLDGPDCPLAWVQIPLFLFLELFIFIGVHMSLPRCSEMIIPYYTLNTTGYEVFLQVNVIHYFCERIYRVGNLNDL